MKIISLATFLFIFYSFTTCVDSYSQTSGTFSVSFEKKSINVQKLAKQDVLTTILINGVNVESSQWATYKIFIEVDRSKTTLAESEYSIDCKFTTINNLINGSNTIYLNIKGDSISDRQRKVILKLIIKNGAANAEHQGAIKELEIIIDAAKKDYFEEYAFLSYVGTNFDLVDGIKAKNLFFATNVYIPPYKHDNKYGVYFSLYGNRTMNDVDSSSLNFQRSYTSLNDTSHLTITTGRQMISSRVSDNIGAFISALIPLNKNSTSDLKLYYAPSLEFVWRRSVITQTYGSIVSIDTALNQGLIPGGLIPIANRDKIERRANEYAFNIGLFGLFMVLENKAISLRVNGSVGYASNYNIRGTSPMNNNLLVERHPDMFFSGNAWITEPKTGLTLQAQITNSYKYSRPYFGVTLSKAFSLSDLGGIFSPITSRK